MEWITYVGIDVAKDKLDVAIKITEEGQPASPTKRPHEAWTSENTDEGVAESASAAGNSHVSRRGQSRGRAGGREPLEKTAARDLVRLSRMLPPLTFGRWFPFAGALMHMPDEPGVFQLRREQGLVDFPRGKSAMLRYGAAESSLRRSFSELLAEPGPAAKTETKTEANEANEASETSETSEGAEAEAWLVRWATSPIPREHYGRLLRGFTERFGAPPRDQPESTCETP